MKKKKTGQAQWLHLESKLLERQRSGGFWFKSRLGKKLARPHSTNMLGVVVHICNVSYIGGIGFCLPGQKCEILPTK
jgi:hypothetical protein